MNTVEALRAALALMQVIRELTEGAKEMEELFSRLQAEGRDLTDAELADIQARTDTRVRAARDRLGALRTE